MNIFERLFGAPSAPPQSIGEMVGGAAADPSQLMDQLANRERTQQITNYMLYDSPFAEIVQAPLRGLQTFDNVAMGRMPTHVANEAGEMVPNPQMVSGMADLAGSVNVGTITGAPRGALGSGAVRQKINNGNAMFSVIPDESVNLYDQGVFAGFDEAGVPSVRINPKNINASQFGMSLANKWAERLRGSVEDALDPKYDHFWRFTENKGEIDLAKSGLLRNSYNHAENFYENGLSVADSPHYAIAGYPYGYGVRGPVIGSGSDGEPLLDPKSLEIVTRMMPVDEINRSHWTRAKEIEKKYGFDIDTARAYSKTFGNPVGFYLPDGSTVWRVPDKNKGRIFVRDGVEWR